MIFCIITDSDGNPNVFNVNRNDSESSLNANYGRPGNGYGAGFRWAFSQI